MICPYCKKEMQATDGFCEHCDAYVGNLGKAKPAEKQVIAVKKEEPRRTLRPGEQYCSKCGYPVDRLALSCPHCNSNMRPIAHVSSTDNNYYRRTTNSYALPALICAFLIPILGLILGIIGKNKAQNECGGEGAGMCTAAILISILYFLAVGAVCCATCNMISNLNNY